MHVPDYFFNMVLFCKACCTPYLFTIVFTAFYLLFPFPLPYLSIVVLDAFSALPGILAEQKTPYLCIQVFDIFSFILSADRTHSTPYFCKLDSFNVCLTESTCITLSTPCIFLTPNIMLSFLLCFYMPNICNFFSTL